MLVDDDVDVVANVDDDVVVVDFDDVVCSCCSSSCQRFGMPFFLTLVFRVVRTTVTLYTSQTAGTTTRTGLPPRGRGQTASTSRT